MAFIRVYKLSIYYRPKSTYIYLSISLPTDLPFLLTYSILFYASLSYLPICLSLYRRIYVSIIM